MPYLSDTRWDEPPPVWLLDVDGVINVKRPGWGAAPLQGRAYALGAEWRLRWAPALVQRIRRLHRDGVAEVRWCSTWCAWPGEVERLFKLPGLDRAFGEVPDFSVAKLAAARTVLREGRRLVWTDDVEVPEPGPLHDELVRDGRALLIRPDPRRGLQPRHLDAIEAFCTTPLES
ncbi:HAD domain-containing protein [Dactylosporangium sp. CA-052675]|uniref:HAD domain-containing protein n=1 Tax=Dactylosporangium sp. CA-052675 TaxID=3239927 RepID=UPI003D8D2FE1